MDRLDNAALAPQTDLPALRERIYEAENWTRARLLRGVKTIAEYQATSRILDLQHAEALVWADYPPTRP